MDDPSLLEMSAMGFDTSFMDSTSNFGARKQSKSSYFKNKLKCLNLTILWCLIMISLMFNVIGKCLLSLLLL